MKKNLCLFLCALFLIFSGTTRGQVISTFAGNGIPGYTGDGGAATAARLQLPAGIAIDGGGNVYVGGFGNGVIRKINTTGVISTFAGNGTSGNAGDGGPATAALLTSPIGMVTDALGNIYFSDESQQVVRKIDAFGVITTVAGTGASGFSGDGGPATAAMLSAPTGLAIDGLGDLYIADQSNNRIRKVDALGFISTVAGNGTAGFTADGVAATASELNNPLGVAVDGLGNIYIADGLNNRVRKVDGFGMISTMAGNGTSGYSGDGGAATAAMLAGPSDVIADRYGNVYITDAPNNGIRKIDAIGTISTLAGNGTLGYTGDGGAATAAELNNPFGLVQDNNGNIFIADYGNNVVRFVLLNHAPAFAGGFAQPLNICENAPATGIDGLLAVNDADAGQTETWTVLAPPVNGTLSGFPATAPSTGGTVSPSGLTYTPMAGYSGSDIFTIRVDDGNGGTTTTTISVTIYATPTMFTPSDQTVCNGALTAPVNFTSSGSGTTYSWTNSNTTIGLAASGSGNIASFTATNASASIATATITVTPSANGCTGISQSFTITVNPTPTVGSISDVVACNGATTSLISFTGTVSGTVYNWTNDNSSIGLANTGTGNISPFTATNTLTVPNTGDIVVTPTANGCPGTVAPFKITVNATPGVITPASQSLCNGSTTAPISFTGTVPGSTFNWNNSDPGIGLSGSGTGDIPAFVASNTTTATRTAAITVTPSANGCTGTTGIFTITVYPTPTLSSTPTPAAICDSSAFFYVSTSATTGTTFAWSRATVAGIRNTPASGADTINEVLINTTSAPVTVTYVDTLSANGCINLENITVNINPLPLLSSTLTPAAMCDSQTFNYTPTSAVSGAAFHWTRPFVLGIDLVAATGIGNPNEKIVNNTNGDLNVTYIYLITANGCNNTQNVVVTIHPTPRLSSVTAANVCSNSKFNYTATGFTSGTTFAWSRAAVTGITPGTASGTGNISDSVSSSISSPVAVTYVYTLTANGCTHKQNVVLTVNPSAPVPVIDNNPPASLCSNTMYQSFGTSIAPATGVKYTWSAINANVWASGNNKQYALVNFPTPGTASVTLTASTANGCSSTNSVSVNVGTDVSDAAPVVMYTNSQFICLQNNESGYQWGYDDATTLQSTILAGEINQNYFNDNPGLAARHYWVIISHNGCKQKAYYNKPLSVMTNNDVTTIKVYPNPAMNNINVEINSSAQTTCNLEVYDMLGQMVRTAATSDNITSINVQDLAPGIYLINCTRDGLKIATTRFIKN